MKKLIVSIGAFVVVCVAIRVGLSLAHPQSDAQQIREALNESIQASREGRSGGVMDLLSKQISVNEQDQSGNLGQLSSYIRKSRPDITVESEDPIVTGDTAEITSPVSLRFSFFGQEKTLHAQNVVMLFRKENDTVWGVFPASKWKLFEIQSADLNPSDFN